jgi:hypothetical protein
MGLGSVSELSLEAARHEAYTNQKLVDAKVDSKAQRDEERKERDHKREERKTGKKTFQVCAEEYLAVHKRERGPRLLWA